MPLIVGNLLIDPDATSFISLADAVDYLTGEAGGAGPETPIGAWLTAGDDAQESSLVAASRWMAVSLPWCSAPLSGADLSRVGHVTARLAVQALTVDLWAAGDARGNLIEETLKAGSAQTTEKYDGRGRGAAAGGKRFPWINAMLRGLLCGSGAQHNVVRR